MAEDGPVFNRREIEVLMAWCGANRPPNPPAEVGAVFDKVASICTVSLNGAEVGVVIGKFSISTKGWR